MRLALIIILLVTGIAAEAAPSVQKISAQELLALISQGQYHRAERIIQQNIERGAKRPAVHYLQGYVLWKLLRYQEAEAALRKAVHSAPSRANWQHDLATLLSERDRCAEAIKFLSVAISLAPTPDRHFDRAICARNIGDAVQAKTDLERVIAAAPSHGLAQQQLGELLADGGQWHAALAHLEQAQKLLPTDAENWFQSGQVHVALKRSDLAEEDYRRSLKRNPNHLGALLGLGRLLMSQHKRDEGMLLLQRFKQQQQTQEVIQNRRQYLQQAPLDVGVRLELAKLYLEAQNIVAAKDQLLILENFALANPDVKALRLSLEQKPQ